MAQCGHESLNFRVLEENLNYSAKGLNVVFPKYFERAGRDAEAYHRQPERIANVVYADRMGNANAASGDGYKYRGRGAVQLTGADQYARFAQALEKTISETIEYLGTKEGALESACWFWNNNNINKYADGGDIRGSTKRINGGYNGLADREHHYEVALDILSGDSVPPSRPLLVKVGSTGEHVKDIQRALELDVDGHFGKVTEAAVLRWQEDHGMTVDGIVGPRTYAALVGQLELAG
jgi:putative chitinase|tara:strand:- start:1590 stop:2300 length:711 start_codon:yes stop_codon:yes gene_type:complete